MLAVVRTLPDELRMYGRAFHAIADRESRPIPYARFASTPAPSWYLADEAIITAIVAEFSSDAVQRVLSEEAALTLLAAMASPSHSPATVRSRVIAVMKVLRVALPSRVAARLTPRYQGPEPLTAMQLAFRATIASKTVALLGRDAVALDRNRVDRPAGLSARSDAQVSRTWRASTESRQKADSLSDSDTGDGA